MVFHETDIFGDKNLVDGQVLGAIAVNLLEIAQEDTLRAFEIQFSARGIRDVDKGEASENTEMVEGRWP